MGKISDLIKILKGEGDVAAVRRAERIGDEAPYAAERIDERALRSAISGGDNAASLAIISPQDFRYLAQQLPSDYMSRNKVRRLGEENISPEQYIKDLGVIAQKQGFRDIPFLEYGEYDLGPEIGVKGHEGRHRMRSLEALGDEKALVRLLPRHSVREPLPRRSRSEFLEALAEKYGVPLRLLPEDFKDRDPFDAEGNEIEEFTRTVQPFGKGSLVKQSKKFTKKDLSAMGAELETSTGSLVDLARKYPQVKDRSIADIGTMSDEDVIDAYRALVVRKGVPLRKETTPSTTIEPGVALDILQNAPIIIKGNEFIEPEGVLRTYRNVPVSKTEVYVPSLIDEVIEQNIDPADINVKTKRAGKMKLADIFRQVQKERELLADVSELTPEDFVFTADKGFSPATLMSVARDVARGRWKGAEDYLKYQHFMDREKAIADLDEFAEDFVKRLRPQKFGAGGLAKFFSAVDEAVANLRQKKGTGEQMLKQIQQSPGVKKEEIELRKLPEKLAGQQKVTQEDIQAMLKAVPVPKLELTTRGGKAKKGELPDIEAWLDANIEGRTGPSRRQLATELKGIGLEVVQNPEDLETIGFLNVASGDIFDYADARIILLETREEIREEINDAAYRLGKLREQQPDFDSPEFPVVQQEMRSLQSQLEDLRAKSLSYTEALDGMGELIDDWNSSVNVKPLAVRHKDWQTPGPSENYRELLIRLGDDPKVEIKRPPFEYGRQGLGGDPEELAPEEALRRLGLTHMDDLGGGDNVESVLYYPSSLFITKSKDGKYYTLAPDGDILTENLAEAEDWLSRAMESELKPPIYESGSRRTTPFVAPQHFSEKDIVVHTRVNDRVGPNGEKILYVEEIQSDWHQLAKGNKTAKAKELLKANPALQEEIEQRAKNALREEFPTPLTAMDPEDPARVRKFNKLKKQFEKETIREIEKSLPKNIGYEEMGTRIPPWQQTSHELAVKQILDTAANEGYDKVVFAPGSEQVRRYSLGTYVNELRLSPDGRGGFQIAAVTKDGDTKSYRSTNQEELAELIGEERAESAIEQFEQGARVAEFKENELLLGGEKARGKLKIYDEIIPQYLSKYAGKEFNVQPGRTAIPAEDAADVMASYEYKKQDQMYKDLFDKFQAGGLDEELDFEIREMLEDATLKQVQRGIFSPAYGNTPYTRFMERFAKSQNPNAGSTANDIDYLVSELEPESFGRGTGMIANIIPEKVRFKDPAKQAEYEQFLEEEWLSTTLNPRMREDIIEGRLRRKVEDEILRMDPKVLYADMPPVKTLEGASIDITPEMREKIKTRGQPLFAVPPAVGAAAVLSDEEEPVQEYKEAGRVEKKKGMQQEQFDPPFDESRRIGPKPGVSAGPAKIRDLTKILRGENTEAKNLERQRIEGNLQAAGGLREYMYDMLVPQTGWEWAAEAAFFPVPRPVRKGLLAAAGAMYDPEAEAGKLSLLHGSPSKITNLQPAKDLWATTDPEYALKRAMDKMRIAEGARGPGMVNRFEIEDTDLMRLTDKYSPEDIALARRAFSKLPEGQEMTGEEIYEIASTNTGGAKTAALEGVTRALGKKGYQVPAGAADKGDWYRVLDQTDLIIGQKAGGKITSTKGRKRK